MGFFENIKQRHLTPCLHREREVLKGTDLASSRVVSPASSTVRHRVSGSREMPHYLSRVGGQVRAGPAASGPAK